MGAHSKVTRNFRVTIPKAVREHMGVKAGDLVSFEFRDGELVLKREREADEGIAKGKR